MTPGKTDAKRARPLRKRGAVQAGDPARFYYKGNRYKQLRAFVAIAKLGTLARAAESLFLSSPSISLQLQALERELGRQLVERGRRRVTLTRAGQALFEQARPLVEGMDTLDTRFHSAIEGLAMLRSNQADFAVGSMLDVPHDITYQPFRNYDPMLILPLGHPLADKPDLRLADLSPFGLILPPHRLTT